MHMLPSAVHDCVLYATGVSHTPLFDCAQANGRGYWDTSEENLERLRQLYTDVEVRSPGFRMCGVGRPATAALP